MPSLTHCSAKVKDEQLSLSLAAHPRIEGAGFKAWVILKSSPSAIYQKTMIIDLYEDPNSKGPEIPQKGNPSGRFYIKEIPYDPTFSRALFMVEDRRDFDESSFSECREVPILAPKPDIEEDGFEPDDDPNWIMTHPGSEILVNGPPSRHTFYCEKHTTNGICNDADCFEIDPNDSIFNDTDHLGNSPDNRICNDTDWVYLDAVEGNTYEIYARDLSEYGYFIRPTLYDETLMPLLDPNTGSYYMASNYLNFPCTESGVYLLKSELASSYPAKGVEYIILVCDTQGGVPADISGRILDQDGNGIDGLRVQVRDDDGNVCPGYAYTVSISGKDQGGYFCIHNIEKSLEILTLEVYLHEPNKPDRLVCKQPLPSLFSYSNTRIDDIMISEDEIHSVPQEPCKDEMEQYGIQCKDYPESTHCIAALGDCNCNLLPEGDYDGDRLTNQEEVCFYNTSPLLPTITLPLSRGRHLLYLPSVSDEKNIITRGRPTSEYNVYYYDSTYDSTGYDSAGIKWRKHEGKGLLRPNHFNAIDCPEPALLCLDINKGNNKPVLYIEGGPDPDFLTRQSPSDPNQDLFDAGCFSPDMSTQEILRNPDYLSIKMISGQDPLSAGWESNYRFFGKPSGRDITMQPYAVYFVTKKGGEDKVKKE